MKYPAWYWKVRRFLKQLFCRHEETEYGGEAGPGPDDFQPFVCRCTKCFKLLRVFNSMDELREHAGWDGEEDDGRGCMEGLNSSH